MTYWIIWRKVIYRGETIVYFLGAAGRGMEDYPHMFSTAKSAEREMDWLIKNQPDMGWQCKEIKFG